MFKDMRAVFLTRMALFAILVATASGVHAKGIFDDDDDEDAARPPTEWAVVLPAFPKPENLLSFTAAPTATFEFAIDSKSLSVNAGEVRYTVIATSRWGARNISYEGISCSRYEMRRYAIGHEGKWMPAHSNKWLSIPIHSPNQPQPTLVRDFFCDGKMVEGTADQMLDRIRYNRTLQELNKYKGS